MFGRCANCGVERESVHLYIHVYDKAGAKPRSGSQSAKSIPAYILLFWVVMGTIVCVCRNVMSRLLAGVKFDV